MGCVFFFIFFIFLIYVLDGPGEGRGGAFSCSGVKTIAGTPIAMYSREISAGGGKLREDLKFSKGN